MFQKEEFESLVRCKSDINEHLPTLARYAKECNHITEFGVREWVSTRAILFAIQDNPDAEFHAYDKKLLNIAYLIHQTALDRGIKMKLIEWDVLESIIDDTDMLFIDTLHNWMQVFNELVFHADKVRKYILFHDTVTFREKWETEEYWLKYWMERFLENHPERKVREVFTNNNWLTVWERVGQ